MEIALKKSIVYQLCYNRGMANVIAQRMQIKSWVQGLTVITLIFLALWLGRVEKYRFTPDTSFTTINGEIFTLKSLQGKPILITFWATSCGSCIKEIPHLVALYQQFHPQGLEIIAIAMAYDPPNRVVAMANELKLPYHVVLDISSDHAKAFGRIWATPTSFLLGADGMVNKRIVGTFKLADMQDRIGKLLNKL